MILLIADSVCGGFGQAGKRSFVHSAIDNINIDIWDQSATGMSTSDFLSYLQTGNKICEEQLGPVVNENDIELVVISLGNVDGKCTYSQVNFWGFFVPKRYRKENEKDD